MATNKDLEEVACILRRIWFRRNKFVFDNKFDSPKSVWLGGKEKVDNFQQVQDMIKVLTPKDSSANKPLTSFHCYKANWEDALNVSYEDGCWNSDKELGCWISGLFMYVLFVNSLVMAEIHALESAMEFSMEIGLEHVIFEGDALVNGKEVQATAECWN